MKIDLTLLIATRGGCRERQGELDQVHEHASGFLGINHVAEFSNQTHRLLGASNRSNQRRTGSDGVV